MDIADSSANGQVTDSVTFMAFSDTNVAAGVVVDLNGVLVLYDSTNAISGINTQYGYSVGDSVGACARPPTLRHTSVPSMGSGTSCTIRTFNMLLNDMVTLNVTISIAPQNVNGIRILHVTP